MMKPQTGNTGGRALESKCVVCEDTPAFRTYNVTACYRCIEFFGTFHLVSLKCKFGEVCLIHRFIHKPCEACWLSKCLKQGMKRVTVKHPIGQGPVPTLDTSSVHSKAASESETLVEAKCDSVRVVPLDEDYSESELDDSVNDPSYKNPKENRADSDSSSDTDDSVSMNVNSDNLSAPEPQVLHALPFVKSLPNTANLEVDLVVPIFANDSSVDKNNESDAGHNSGGYADHKNEGDVELNIEGDADQNNEGNSEHNDEVDTTFKSSCPTCSRKFKNLCNLKKHEEKCGSRFLCLKCGIMFKEIKYLKSHIKAQHSELKYLCENCELRFKSSAKLRSHAKVHQDDSTVSCPICDKVFKSKMVLKSHKHKKHSKEEPTEKKSWTCPVCSKVYGSDRGLRYHMEYHKDSTVSSPVSAKASKLKSHEHKKQTEEQTNTEFPVEEVEINPIEIDEESIAIVYGEEVVIVPIGTEDPAIGGQEIAVHVIKETLVNVTDIETDH